MKALSGGERNRVILAKLFTRPANLLVLDEPTNDLDIETLEVLEEKLCDYAGTLIVVSHDREFLDNVVTSTIVFEEDGRVQEYVGGYSDWVRKGRQLAVTDNPYETERRKREAAERRKRRQPTKLGYKDQRELDALPTEIEDLESAIASLQQVVADPGFYAQDNETVQAKLRELADAETLLEQRVERWTELESMVQSFQFRLAYRSRQVVALIGHRRVLGIIANLETHRLVALERRRIVSIDEQRKLIAFDQRRPGH